MKKIVSIITPSFNRANVVTETAESILAQTYPHWEWVIVDDGSTDNSWEVLQSIAARDNRIKIFQRHRGPKGACVCRNIAVENSTGDYVMFLDTDDVMAPYCLAQRVAAMAEHPDCDFVIFPMLMFEKQLDDLNTLWNVDNDRDDIKRILSGDAVCQGTGPLWKRTSFVEAGMWREDLALWQDTELHIRSILWPMRYIKRLDLLPDVYLRVSYTSLSRSGYYSSAKLKSRMEIAEYTCRLMKEKGVFETYRKELKNWAADIATGAITGGHYAAGRRMIDYCIKEGLITPAEAKAIKNYLFVRKYKLSKIGGIDNYFHSKAHNAGLRTASNIGKIHWRGAETACFDDVHERSVLQQ